MVLCESRVQGETEESIFLLIKNRQAAGFDDLATWLQNIQLAAKFVKKDAAIGGQLQ